MIPTLEISALFIPLSLENQAPQISALCKARKLPVHKLAMCLLFRMLISGALPSSKAQFSQLTHFEKGPLLTVIPACLILELD